MLRRAPARGMVTIISRLWASVCSVSSRACPLDVQGRIFLDRCGQLFAEVLSLLTEWRPPEDRCAWSPVGALYVGWGEVGWRHALRSEWPF